MKKMMLFSLITAFLIMNVSAQIKETKSKKDVKTAVTNSVKSLQDDRTIVILSNISAYQALGTPSRLTIADPLINAMNHRSAGTEISYGSSNIIGMPKGMFGIANGKILLRNSTATSSGTVYGSGAVGTGTAIHGAGASESTIGVNGKSPMRA